jgi:branched-chain amino acid transport system permease protein
MRSRLLSGGHWSILPVALLIAAVPLLTRGNAYYMTMGTNVGLYSITGLGLALLLGYAGQISLGHAAFYGMGAFGSAILVLHYSWNPWLALLVAAAATGVIAYLVGQPTLKLRGHYLAMATLGFGIIVKIIFDQAATFTGGPSGLPDIPKLSIGGFVFTERWHQYLLVWGVLLLLMVLAQNLLNSRLGRALRAIHDSELAARSCAVDAARAKLAVFVVSAVFASLAGSLYAHITTFVNPGPFGFKTSIEFVVMIIVGGAATLWGPVIGAAALTLLTQLLVYAGNEFPPAKELDVVLYGAILILMLLFQPRGLARLFHQKREVNHDVR